MYWCRTLPGQQRWRNPAQVQRSSGRRVGGPSRSRSASRAVVPPMHVNGNTQALGGDKQVSSGGSGGAGDNLGASPPVGDGGWTSEGGAMEHLDSWTLWFVEEYERELSLHRRFRQRFAKRRNTPQPAHSHPPPPQDSTTSPLKRFARCSLPANYGPWMQIRNISSTKCYHVQFILRVINSDQNLIYLRSLHLELLTQHRTTTTTRKRKKMNWRRKKVDLRCQTLKTHNKKECLVQMGLKLEGDVKREKPFRIHILRWETSLESTYNFIICCAKQTGKPCKHISGNWWIVL